MAQLDSPQPLAPGDFRAASVRGVDGFFRVGQASDGRWWFLDPAGATFFCRAVDGVRELDPPLDAADPAHPTAALRRWGFNTLGVGSDENLALDGLAVIRSADLASSMPVLSAPGVWLPDVFAPEWGTRATQRALEVCAPWANARELLGWMTDDRLQWGAVAGTGMAMLLQTCLSLEPSFAAYHAAWEFVLALHGGRLDALARAWGVEVANREGIRELTRNETAVTSRGYLRDDARWAQEFARRYFTTAGAAIRAADPNHLVFGSSGRGSAATQAECVYPAVDVVVADSGSVPASTLSPVLIGGVSWTGVEYTRATTARDRALTSLERRLRRSRAALEKWAQTPAVVGYIWQQWQDQPAERPPFGRGLLHADGGEAREHTELLAYFNARAETLRRAPPKRTL